MKLWKLFGFATLFAGLAVLPGCVFLDLGVGEGGPCVGPMETCTCECTGPCPADDPTADEDGDGGLGPCGTCPLECCPTATMYNVIMSATGAVTDCQIGDYIPDQQQPNSADQMVHVVTYNSASSKDHFAAGGFTTYGTQGYVVMPPSYTDPTYGVCPPAGWPDYHLNISHMCNTESGDPHWCYDFWGARGYSTLCPTNQACPADAYYPIFLVPDPDPGALNMNTNMTYLGGATPCPALVGEDEGGDGAGACDYLEMPCVNDPTCECAGTPWTLGTGYYNLPYPSMQFTEQNPQPYICSVFGGDRETRSRDIADRLNVGPKTDQGLTLIAVSKVAIADGPTLELTRPLEIGIRLTPVDQRSTMAVSVDVSQSAWLDLMDFVLDNTVSKQPIDFSKWSASLTNGFVLNLGDISDAMGAEYSLNHAGLRYNIDYWKSEMDRALRSPSIKTLSR